MENVGYNIGQIHLIPSPNIWINGNNAYSFVERVYHIITTTQGHAMISYI
jgi:hypothetical protein